MLSAFLTEAPSLNVEAIDSMPPFWLIPVFVVSAWAIIFGLVFGIDPNKESGPLARALYFTVAVAGLVGVVTGATIIASESTTRDEAKAEYAASVSGWLSDDYGIDTNEAAVSKLIYGEALTADYDGRQVVITLGETTTGRLSVIDENRTVLETLAD